MPENQSHSIYYPEFKDLSFFQQQVALQDEVGYKQLSISTDSVNYILLRNQPSKIIQTGIPVIDNQKKTFFTEKTSKKSNPYVYNIKPKLHPDWIFFVLILTFSLFALIRTTNNKRISVALKGIFVKRQYQQLIREGNYASEPMAIFFNIIYFLSFALSLFLLVNKFSQLENGKISGLYLFSIILAMVVLVFAIKQLGLRFIAYIFKTKNDSLEFLLNNMLVNQLVGISILPFIVFYIYAFSMLSLWILITLITLFFIYRNIRFLFLGFSNNKFPLFYLFLYLCTVEILPIFISIKLIINLLTIKV